MAMYGIIGHGTVGKAVSTGLLRNGHKFWVKDPIEQTREFDNVCLHKAVFICVPTPAGLKGYDLTAVRDALDHLVEQEYDSVVILMSTIGPKDYVDLRDHMKQLGASYHLFVSPEFLTERGVGNDLYYETLVYYAPWINPALDLRVRNALRAPRLASDLKIRRLSVEECSLLKTRRNAALTQKLLAANMVYFDALDAGLTDKKAQALVDMVFSDPRLATKHEYHKVGNHEGTFGVAGKCLPKDLRAMANSSRYPYYDELVKTNQVLNTIKLRSRSRSK